MAVNNKAQEVNSQLMNMSGKRDIIFVDHTDTIDIERYLNESKFHLNKSGPTEFANFANFFCSRIDIAVIVVVILP